MNPDSIQDSTRVVVSGVRHGGILPGSRSEMWREVYLLSGADVRGAVWGSRLAIEGPAVRIDDAIYVRGELRVSKAAKTASTRRGVTLGSCVTAGDSIVVDDVPFRVRFLSNLYTGVANLRRSVVYGNVYARTAIIRDSVIMGGVFAKETLTLENCILGTFRGGTVRIGKGVALLFPIAMAEASIALDHPVKALSFLRVGTARPKEPGGGAVTLTSADLYEVSEATHQDGTALNVHLLSLDQRILDATPVMEEFRKNRETVECLALLDQLEPTLRAKLRAGPATKLESRLWALLDEPQLPELEGYSDIADLARRPEVLAGVRSAVSEELAGRLGSSDLVLASQPPSNIDQEQLPPEVEALFHFRDS